MFAIDLTESYQNDDIEAIQAFDKFEKTGFTKEKSVKVSPPTIAECPVALECKVTEILPMGSHDVFIADIVSVSCKEELFDKDGKMHFERAGLLAYAHGEYYALGEKVGRFGFSTDKGKQDANREEKKDGQSREGVEKKEPFYLAVTKKKRGGKRR